MKIKYGNISRLELYRLAEHPATINLAGYKNPNQIKQERQLNKFKAKVFDFVDGLLPFAKILLIGAVLMLSVGIYKSVNANLETSITYGNFNQAVTVYNNQVQEMIDRGYSVTRILDLLAIKSMECNRYDGLCYGFNNADVGFFQINQIHREQYNHSLGLMRQGKSGDLFLYQLRFANGLLDSYEDRFCNVGAFNYIGRTYNNKERFKCYARSYNGHPRYKYTFANLGWLKRERIKEYLLEEYPHLFNK